MLGYRGANAIAVRVPIDNVSRAIQGFHAGLAKEGCANTTGIRNSTNTVPIRAAKSFLGTVPGCALGDPIDAPILDKPNTRVDKECLGAVGADEDFVSRVPLGVVNSARTVR